MSMDMRKNFIQVILTSLIEKSPDPKILRAVVKIVEEWVKNNSPMAANQVKRSHFETPDGAQVWVRELGQKSCAQIEKHDSSGYGIIYLVTAARMN